MIRRVFTLLAFAAVAGGPSLAVPVRAADPGPLFSRMTHVNAGLRSYEADVTVAIETHGFPYLSPTLQGRAFYERPDRTAVQFDAVPAIASQLKNVVAQIPPPAEWPALYEIAPTGDDGTTATFRLVPRKAGRVDHVDVTVDDATATVTGMRYAYKDGGTVSFTQSYDRIGGAYVVARQVGKVEIPHYSADVVSTFANYRLNVAIPEAVFAE